MRLINLPRCVTAALAAISLGGCAIFGYDHSERIASKTVLESPGHIDKAAYSAALSAKFPSGSSIGLLRAYVAEIEGKCEERDVDLLWCEIPVRGQFCAASMLGIKARLQDGKIDSLEVVLSGLSC